MDIRVFVSGGRGYTDYGWMKTRCSFTFGDYYNSNRMGFGALRVLNDNWIEPGKGFGDHRHNNMEIVTIVLKGELEHRDNKSHHSVVSAGEVQCISSGKGVMHSEFNHSPDKPLQFLQLWLLPKKQNVKPSYGQRGFELPKNTLVPVVGRTGLKINQDALIFLGKYTKGKKGRYSMSRKSSGVYLFLINGEMKIGKETLKTGDGAAIMNTSSLSFTFTKNSHVMLVEIPLDF